MASRVLGQVSFGEESFSLFLKELREIVYLASSHNIEKSFQIFGMTSFIYKTNYIFFSTIASSKISKNQQFSNPLNLVLVNY